MPEVPSFAMYSACNGGQLQLLGTMEAHRPSYFHCGNWSPKAKIWARPSRPEHPATLTSNLLATLRVCSSATARISADIVSAQINCKQPRPDRDNPRPNGKIEGADPSIRRHMDGKLIAVRFGQTQRCSIRPDWWSGLRAETFATLSFWASAQPFPCSAVFLPRPRREIFGPQGGASDVRRQAAQQANGDPMFSGEPLQMT